MNRSIPCVKCDRMFKDEHGLKQHMADAHKVGKRPRREERYPLRFDDADINAEYEPRQLATGCWEEG